MKLRLLPVLLVVFSVGATVQAPASYEKARQHQAQGNLRAAELELRNSLQQDPTYLPARLLLGQLLQKSGQWASAEKELQLALDGGAAPDTLLAPLAHVLLMQQKTDAAEQLLNSYPQLQQKPEVQLAQAYLAKARQQYATAKTLLTTVQASGSAAQRDEASFALAELQYLQQQFAQVPATLAGISPNPQWQQKARYLLAQNHLVQQQGQQALAIYQQLLQQDPQDPIALLGRARVLQQQGKVSEALETVVQYRQRYPDNPYGQLIHAALLGEQGQDREQQRMLRQIEMQLAQLPDSHQSQPDVMLLAASLELSQGKTDAALSRLHQATPLYPEFAPLQQLLAQAYLQKQDYKAAAVAARKALSLSSSDPQLYLLVAAIARAGNNATEEQQTLATAFAKFATEPQIRRAYIQVLLRNQQQDKARALLTATANNNQADAILLGYLQLEQGLLTDAQQTAQQLLQQDQGKVEIFQLAGDVAAKSGDADLARQFYQQALVLVANYRPALLSLASLALQQQDHKAATAYYQQLLQQDPADPLVLQLLADSSLHLGQLPAAIAALEQLDPANRQHLDARLVLLDLYLQQQMLPQASALAEQLAEQTDMRPELYFAKAKLAVLQRNPVQLRSAAEMLLGLWYDNAAALSQLADLQLQANDMAGARQTVNRLTQLNGSPATLHLLQARLALAGGELTQSQQWLDRLNANERASAAAREVQALLHLARQQWSKAVQVLQPLYQQSKAQSHFLMLLDALRADPTAQLALVKDWLSANPTDLSATLLLAEQLQQAGQAKLAQTVYQQSPLLTSAPVLQNNLAVLLFEQDPASALQYASQAYEAMPAQPDIIDTYGYALVLNQQAEKGLGVLRDAEIRRPDDVLVQLHIAAALRQLKRDAEVSQILQTLQRKSLGPAEQRLLQQLLGQASY